MHNLFAVSLPTPKLPPKVSMPVSGNTGTLWPSLRLRSRPPQSSPQDACSEIPPGTLLPLLFIYSVITLVVIVLITYSGRGGV